MLGSSLPKPLPARRPAAIEVGDGLRDSWMIEERTRTLVTIIPLPAQQHAETSKDFSLAFPPYAALDAEFRIPLPVYDPTLLSTQLR